MFRSVTVKKPVFGLPRGLSVLSASQHLRPNARDGKHSTQFLVQFPLLRLLHHDKFQTATIRGRGFCSYPKNALVEKTPTDFIKYMREQKINRCFVVYDKKTGKPKASHPELQELADFFANDDMDYRKHEGAFMTIGTRTGALLGVFIWRTDRGQAVSTLTFTTLLIILQRLEV